MISNLGDGENRYIWQYRMWLHCLTLTVVIPTSQKTRKKVTTGSLQYLVRKEEGDREFEDLGNIYRKKNLMSLMFVFVHCERPARIRLPEVGISTNGFENKHK